MRSFRVQHSYTINVRGLSDYGKVTRILEALEPLKNMSTYGYKDLDESVTIWWETVEEK